MYVAPLPRLLAFALLCAACSAGAGTLQVLVQDSNGRPLPDAVVFLESPAAKALAKPVAGTDIAQSGKQFVPLISVVPVGSLVQFPNRDTVRHHVYSFSPAKTFELKLYTGTPANPVLFDRPGVVVLGCNIHDFMTAWILVVETPFYGKTNDTGSVTLAAVAPGNYKLRSWHSTLPPGASLPEQNLTVGVADATLTVNLKGATR
ncbi:methylamine utilization protein [Rhodoferax saidenbachensis]|uniref:Methylamine utilization protein n=1 Tax=Rhodoferax saidenbachensis TaxID=1484693 RepID=A0A1P8KDB5_9BURK|nr:methylamine utilization protein [Rhodoferax saidenbachensis]APW43975.1 methylamine utilization protein [Rhodoferax saidenbachensis]